MVIAISEEQKAGLISAYQKGMSAPSVAPIQEEQPFVEQVAPTVEPSGFDQMPVIDDAVAGTDLFSDTQVSAVETVTNAEKVANIEDPIQVIPREIDEQIREAQKIKEELEDKLSKIQKLTTDAVVIAASIESLNEDIVALQARYNTMMDAIVATANINVQDNKIKNDLDSISFNQEPKQEETIMKF